MLFLIIYLFFIHCKDNVHLRKSSRTFSNPSFPGKEYPAWSHPKGKAQEVKYVENNSYSVETMRLF